MMLNLSIKFRRHRWCRGPRQRRTSGRSRALLIMALIAGSVFNPVPAPLFIYLFKVPIFRIIQNNPPLLTVRLRYRDAASRTPSCSFLPPLLKLLSGVIEFSRFVQNWGEGVMQTLHAVSWKVNRPGRSDILCAKWKVIGESRWWNLSRSAVAGLWFFLRVLSRLIKLFKLKAVKIKQKSIWFGHFIIIFLASLQEVTSSPSPVLMLPSIRYPGTSRPSLPCISFSKIKSVLILAEPSVACTFEICHKRNLAALPVKIWLFSCGVRPAL